MLNNKFQNIFFVAFALMILSTMPAFAIEHIRAYIPAAEKVGEGRMNYMFWSIYDATLYAPAGSWGDDEPFALELTYLRALQGKKIADHSIVEIRSQGFSNEIKLATWHAQMRKIFPDVDEGAKLTGAYTQTGETIFYKDGNEIGRIKDPEFGRAFFDIWLSEKTSEPYLRRKLLGGL
jgi:hypothetical protein